MSQTTIKTNGETKVIDQHIDNQFSVYQGDNIEVIDGLPDESIGLVITSVPFPRMYTYSNSDRDIGNTKSIQEMIDHFKFLASPSKLGRVVKPGRAVAIHLTQYPLFKHSDGVIGRKDFRGDIIRLMQDEGWTYFSEVLIDKCPQVRAQRSKDRGLLFKSLATDSSVMAPVMADYIVLFRKDGENKEPINAGIHKKHGKPGQGWITEEEWIEWASAVWYRHRKDMKGGIRECDTLNVAIAREGDDELHLCPLQLGVIERCAKLWSNPGDVILDPFSGVGSTGVRSVEIGRKYIGIELKRKYFETSIRYLKKAQEQALMPDLFSMFRNTEETEEAESE